MATSWFRIRTPKGVAHVEFDQDSGVCLKCDRPGAPGLVGQLYWTVKARCAVRGFEFVRVAAPPQALSDVAAHENHVE